MNITRVCIISEMFGTVHLVNIFMNGCVVLSFVPAPAYVSEYMRDVLQERTNVQTLHSTVSNQLAIPQSRFEGFGDCTFSIALLRLWNALPDLLQSVNLLVPLKKVLIHTCLNLPLTR